MAKNAEIGKGRVGAVKSRVQYKNPHAKKFVKADTKTGRFMDMKTSCKCCGFKGVRSK